MSLKRLPELKAGPRPKNWVSDAPSAALERWSGLPQAADDGEEATISIYSVIGDDPMMGGFSSGRMAGALRSIGSRAVKVNINSPGGDFFDGVSIYNLLREHPAKVTVHVMGLAASAASIVAMAGDEIEMGAGTTMMIHNSWGAVIGNQNDMREAADIFSKFDDAMLSIYMARTGLAENKLAKMMDKDTFMSAQEAVDLGFADAVVNLPKMAALDTPASRNAAAKRRIDSLLAKEGLTRSERRKLFRELSGTQDAAEPVTQDADELPVAELQRLLKTFTE